MSTYDLAVILKLVNAAFDLEGVNNFCFLYFRPVYDNFFDTDHKNARILRLVEHAERTGQLDTLLAHIKMENPLKYAEYETRLTSPAASSSPESEPDLDLFRSSFSPTMLSSAEIKDWQNLGMLAKKVKNFWIKDVLEKSLHHETLIALDRTIDLEAIAHPWGQVVERPDQESQSMAPDKKISDIFNDLNKAMLILGEAGSGKTITLLELTRELIAQFEADTTFSQPVPTIFNLSSWQDKQPLLEWLGAELSTKYQISKQLGQRWLAEHRILPLLDGLDEVSPKNRADCVEAINAFGDENGLTGLVVCSRLAEYSALPVRLKLNGAIHLQPLTLSQMGHYLTQVKPTLASLHTLLEQDKDLQSLGRTPLMLNIMALVYQEFSALLNSGLISPEDYRTVLFDAYVAKMMRRRGDYDLYTEKQTVQWLAWLAKNMQRRGQSVFIIEQLQPSWLSTRGQQHYYQLSLSLLGAATFIPIVWLLYLSVFGGYVLLVGPLEEPTLLPALMIALGSGLAFGLASLREFSARFVRLLIFSVIALLIGILLSVSGFFESRVAGLFIGVIFGFFGALAGSTFARRKIQLLEPFQWSWANALYGLSIGSVVGGIVAGLSRTEPIINGLELGLPVALVLSFVFGFKREQITDLPAQGVRQSLKRTIIVGLTVYFILITTGALVGSFGSNPAGGLVFGSLMAGMIGLIITLHAGGAAFIQHIVLRFILYREEDILWDLKGFLNFATDHILLRNVGSGYIFIHRWFIDYFAKQ